MRFTDGYWLTRPEFEMNYATEWHRTRRTEGCLSVLAPTRRVASRGTR